MMHAWEFSIVLEQLTRTLGKVRTEAILNRWHNGERLGQALINELPALMVSHLQMSHNGIADPYQHNDSEHLLIALDHLRHGTNR